MSCRWSEGGTAGVGRCPTISTSTLLCCRSPLRSSSSSTTTTSTMSTAARTLLCTATRSALPRPSAARLANRIVQRGLATVQSTNANPVRHYGGLKDQDRVSLVFPPCLYPSPIPPLTSPPSSLLDTCSSQPSTATTTTGEERRASLHPSPLSSRLFSPQLAPHRRPILPAPFLPSSRHTLCPVE